MLSAILLASGFSRRMGTNKLLLPFQGKQLLEHTLDIVIKCNFDQVVLVASDETVLHLGDIRGIKGLKNERAEYGQSEAIKLGVRNVPISSDFVFFTGDQPLLDLNTVKRLINLFQITTTKIVVPKNGDKRGTPVLFPNRFRSELLALNGDTGGRGIIHQHPDCVQFEDVDECFLTDIDTITDYIELINRIKG